MFDDDLDRNLEQKVRDAEEDLCCNPKNESIPPALAGVELGSSLFLLRCCTTSSDRERVLSGSAIVFTFLDD